MLLSNVLFLIYFSKVIRELKNDKSGGGNGIPTGISKKGRKQRNKELYVLRLINGENRECSHMGVILSNA